MSRRPDRHPVPSFPIWLPVLALACLPAAVLVEVVGKVLEWHRRCTNPKEK